jgi:hypothetical protein
VDLGYVIEAFVANREDDDVYSHSVFIVSNLVKIATFSLALYLQVTDVNSMLTCKLSTWMGFKGN